MGNVGNQIALQLFCFRKFLCGIVQSVGKFANLTISSAVEPHIVIPRCKRFRSRIQ